MKRITHAVAAALVVMAMAVAGCDAGDGEARTDPTQADPTEGEESGAPQDDAQAETPLTEYYEALYGSSGTMEEDFEAQLRRIEELVAVCMAEQGFEYIPAEGTVVVSTTDDLDVAWGSREFAETYGYGASTDPWGAAEQQAAVDPDGQTDPNQAYRDAMSESERQAYDEALYGAQAAAESDDDQALTDREAEASASSGRVVDEDGGYITWDWRQAGCYGEAQHEVFDADSPADDPEFSELMEEMQRVWQQVEDDPRVAEADAAWSECMADAGFPGFAATADAQNSIYERVEAIRQDADYSEASTEEDYARIQEEIDAQLAEITPDEIAMAVADYDCQQEADTAGVRLRVQTELERAFVDAHRAELDAMVAAYGGTGGGGVG